MIPNSYRVPGGRVIAGEYPGAIDEADAREKIARLLDAGVSVFVDLTSPADRLVSYEDILRDEGARRGVDAVRVACPIPDMGVEHPDVLNDILDIIDQYAAEGRTVYVHCWGGVGRTGLVVGCHLVRHGSAGDAALESVRSLFGTMSPDKVRAHGGQSPQTAAQCAMVCGWNLRDRRDARDEP